jgi:hypothetical protein
LILDVHVLIVDIFSCPTVLLELRNAYFRTPYSQGVTKHKKEREFFFFFFSLMVPKIEGGHFKNFCLFLKCQPVVDEKINSIKLTPNTLKVYLDIQITCLLSKLTKQN